jgi:hypothetical protein
MKILSQYATEQTQIVQRLSDGSDRRTVTITTYHVEVEDEGIRYRFRFDHEPTEQEINDALAVGEGEIISDPAELARQLGELRQAQDILLMMMLEKEGIL